MHSFTYLIAAGLAGLTTINALPLGFLGLKRADEAKASSTVIHTIATTIANNNNPETTQVIAAMDYKTVTLPPVYKTVTAPPVVSTVTVTQGDGFYTVTQAPDSGPVRTVTSWADPITTLVTVWVTAPPVTVWVTQTFTAAPGTPSVTSVVSTQTVPVTIVPTSTAPDSVTPTLTVTVTNTPVSSTPVVITSTAKLTQTTQSTVSTAYTTTATAAPTKSPNGPWQDYGLPGADGMLLFKPSAIAYSPVEPSNTVKTCRSQGSINSDMQMLSSKSITEIRVHSTDCGAIPYVLPAAASAGIKVILGFNITNTVNDVDASVDEFISWAKSSNAAANNFNVISAICIGDQAVTNGVVEANDLVAKIIAVRAKLLQEIGYSGNIITSETSSTYVLNPNLCDAGTVSYVGTVVRPFDNPYYLASESDQYISSQMNAISNFCSNPVTRVIDAGYPSQGTVYGQQIPSFENQGISVTQMYNYAQGNIVLYTTWNEAWADPGYWNTGNSFGLIDRIRQN